MTDEARNTKIYKDVEKILSIVRWLIFIGFGAGVWITRLEMRVTSTEHDLLRLTTKMEQLLVGSIETNLSLREISTDIKHIHKTLDQYENQDLQGQK